MKFQTLFFSCCLVFWFGNSVFLLGLLWNKKMGERTQTSANKMKKNNFLYSVHKKSSTIEIELLAFCDFVWRVAVACRCLRSRRSGGGGGRGGFLGGLLALSALLRAAGLLRALLRHLLGGLLGRLLGNLLRRRLLRSLCSLGHFCWFVVSLIWLLDGFSEIQNNKKWEMRIEYCVCSIFLFFHMNPQCLLVFCFVKTKTRILVLGCFYLFFFTPNFNRALSGFRLSLLNTNEIKVEMKKSLVNKKKKSVFFCVFPF